MFSRHEIFAVMGLADFGGSELPGSQSVQLEPGWLGAP